MDARTKPRVREGRRPGGPRWAPALLVAALCALAVAPAAQAEGLIEVTQYFYGHEEEFVVPPGNSTIKVVAIGGHGGSDGNGIQGGRGAIVQGELLVAPYQVLYVHVGGNGASGVKFGDPGGGGHASDVRSAPLSAGLSPDPRLVVAGAGGGAGSQARNGSQLGGSRGGNAEEAGQEGQGAEGGGGASPTEAGEGGLGECGSGENGKLELGGAGAFCASAALYGGGGGDGYYGGGGGGANNALVPSKEGEPGGGGGSSLVPGGGTKALAGPVEQPQVQITYLREPHAPVAATGAASSVTFDSADVAGTVDPEGEETSCFFELGTTELYGQSAPCAVAPGHGVAVVQVSAALSKLAPGTTYHYRLVAGNGTGTSYGSDATFTTLPQEKPVVTEVSPNIGPASGGTIVTITGQHLDNASKVRFQDPYGTVEASEVTVNSSESITVTAPPQSGLVGIRTTAHVIVTTPGGTSEPTAGTSYVYVGKPTLAFTVSPATGPAAGGATVGMIVYGAEEVTAVDFGTTPSPSYTVTKEKASQYSYKIQAVAPPGTGVVEISVTTQHGGTSEPTPRSRYHYQSGPPEFGRCVTGDPQPDRFGANTCLAFTEYQRSSYLYEWEPGVVKGGFTGKGTTTVTLETTGHVKTTCTASSDHGAYSGETSVTGVVITLTGCTSSTKHACTSPSMPAGEIVTASLEGSLGWQVSGKKAGVDLAAVGGSPFASYTCGSATTTLEGSVIVPITIVNKMVTVNTWHAVAKEGKQVPEAFVGGGQDVLRNQSNEQVGLTAQIAQTGEEALELNLKF